MKISRIALPFAAACTLIALPAAADNMTPATTTQQSTVTTTQTTTTQPLYHRTSPDPNADIIALHNQAVDLAHQATYAAQHGDRKRATILAGQAQEIFNRTFTMSQEALR